MKKNVLLLILILCNVTIEAKQVIDTLVNGNDTLLTFKNYNENGILTGVSRYKNWEAHEYQEEYYNDGSLKSKTKYDHNCPMGKFIEYHENQNVKLTYKYIDCEIHGVSLHLSSKGDTLGLNYYENGKPVGIHRSWHLNGKSQSITHFNNQGQRHGLRETWREDGTRIDSTRYENGRIVEIREYFYYGSIRQFMRDEDGALDSAAFYDPEGNITGKIINGTGKAIGYSEDGNKRWFDSYENGVRIDSRELKPGENPF